MKKNLFDFQDYKAYLRKLEQARPGKGRGFRAKMAEAMNCQRSFVTKILASGSNADLSLEQADKLNALLGHTKDEGSFFLLLVQYSRAGTESLRAHFRDQMKEILNRRLQASREMQSKNVLSPEDHMRYYSAWYYGAIRVAVSIPQLQTKETLCKRLGLPLATVASALEFLVSRGLVAQNGDHYTHSSQSQVLLSADHPMVSKHHSNWRSRALASLDREGSQDLHYSYVVTLSEHDALRIRSFLVETIQDVLKRAAPSKEETMYSLCLDYFEI